jgi:hypothetical protein
MPFMTHSATNSDNADGRIDSRASEDAVRRLAEAVAGLTNRPGLFIAALTDMLMALTPVEAKDWRGASRAGSRQIALGAVDEQSTVTDQTHDTVRAEPRQIASGLMPLFLELTGEETSDEWARGAGLYIRHVRKTMKASPFFSKLFRKLLSENEAWVTAPQSQKYFFNQIVAIHWRRSGWIWFTRDSCSLSEGSASRAFRRDQRAKSSASRFVVTELRAFRLETELEDHLRAHPSILGPDLLIIGKQVATPFGILDLLAIAPTGVIHNIELKLGRTAPAIVGQVTDYLYWVQQLDRDEIIRIAARGLFGIDLEAVFHERFGHPLPEVVNQTQVLSIIAAAIDLRTQRGMMAIRHPGLSTTMFRYVIQSGAVSLIPCCRNGQDPEAAHAVPRPQTLRQSVTAPVSYLTTGFRVPVDDNVREFWLTHAQHFPPIVLFSVIYAEYKQWVRAQASEEGLFGRQLVAIVAESDEWVHVFIPTGSTMKSLASLKSLPATRTSPAPGYQTVAYMKNPVYQKSETASS